MSYDKMVYLTSLLPVQGCQIKYEIKKGMELWFERNEDFLLSLFFLKNHTPMRFQWLNEETCVDFLRDQGRFRIYIVVTSLENREKLILSSPTTGKSPLVNQFSSLVSFFQSSNWLEREIWDLFGIYFLGHSDLRRILTDYGFEGFPLRKDFPVVGYVEVRYDESYKTLVYEPVELVQELREFQFSNPWGS